MLVQDMNGTGLAAISSVFGGSGFDMGSAMAVDGSGNAYLTVKTFTIMGQLRDNFPCVNAQYVPQTALGFLPC